MIERPSTGFARGRSIFRRLSGSPTREYYLYCPTTLRTDAPILVAVHGISMNAAEQMVRLRHIAEDKGMIVIAPYFSKSLYPGYQQLVSKRTGARADLALLDIVNNVGAELGLSKTKFVLIGFSGGAQFAHRFAFYHANRVALCISCAAGWYTYPQFDEPYPTGLRVGTGPHGISAHPEWVKVRHHVIIGSLDTAVEPALNMKPEIADRQGKGRLERARRWVKAMNLAAADNAMLKVDYSEIPGLGHDFGEAHDQFHLAKLISQDIESII